MIDGSRSGNAELPTTKRGQAKKNGGMRFRNGMALVCAVLSVVGWNAHSLAQSGSGPVLNYPTSGPAKSGLNSSIDLRWVEGLGYRPVVVTITPVAPTTIDRTLRLELRSFRRYQPRDAVVASKMLEIPAGSGPVTTTIFLPQVDVLDRIAFEVWEDGRRLDELSTPEDTGLGLASPTPVGGQVPKLLFVTDDPNAPGTTMPDLSGLYRLTGNTVYYGGAPRGPVAAGNVNQANVMTMWEASLPSDWRWYSALDAICLTPDKLRQIYDQEPAAWLAIDRWVRAGGNLWLLDVGSNWEKFGDILHVFPSDKTTTAAGNINLDPFAHGWSERFPNPRQSLSLGQPGMQWNLDGTAEQYGNRYFVQPDGSLGQVNPNSVPNSPKSEAPPESNAKARFALRDHGLGQIAAAQEAPFGTSPAPWLNIFSVVGEHRWTWILRNGLNYHSLNNDFWNFLIPGVGLPPVRTFQALITLFVVVVGPLNYFWLRRRTRLHLLLVTVPAAAMLVAGSLFAYAVVKDGLGVRARARSFTLLDQRGGEAVSWARLSYYAGLAPSDGLVFPGDAVVLPIDWGPRRGRGGDAPPLVMHHGRQQYLTSGWLPSRTPTQLLTVRARNSDAKIDLKPGEDGAIKARNALGSRILHLFVCDQEGTWHQGQGIPSDGEAVLRPVEDLEVSQTLRGTLNNHRAISEGMTRGRPNMNRRYYRSASHEYSQPEPQITQSVLEDRGLQKMAGDVSNTAFFAPGHYIAIVEKSPEVEYGLPSFENAGSFHAIVGIW